MYLHLLQYFWPQVIRITKVVSNNFWNATKKSPELPNKVHTLLYNLTELPTCIVNFFKKANYRYFYKFVDQKKSHNILSSNLY